MGGLAEAQLADAADAIAKRDTMLAERAISGDPDIDALQQQIEDQALKLLALRQPMAVDLRETLAAIKIASELERIGDLAKNIAKISMARQLLTWIYYAMRDGQVRSLAAAARQAHADAVGAHGRARHPAEQLALLKPRVEDALATLAPLMTRAEEVRQLAELAEGRGANQYKMTLSSFVLAARLEEVVRRLESPQLSLDDAMKLFDEGVALSRECQKQLEEAEGSVEILLKKADGKLAAEPFGPEGESES